MFARVYVPHRPDQQKLARKTLMPNEKYPLPPFMAGICTPHRYRKWLNRKAAAHHKRDRKRGNPEATREAYKVAIHQAVLGSRGVDEYTGRPLDWAKIGDYRNEESARGRRKYKHLLGDLPTVDHVGDGLGEAEFKICSWRVNDAKHDLGLDDFLELCRQVLEHHERPATYASDQCQPQRLPVTNP